MDRWGIKDGAKCGFWASKKVRGQAMERPRARIAEAAARCVEPMLRAWKAAPEILCIKFTRKEQASLPAQVFPRIYEDCIRILRRLY